jgi:hypothetical protein
LRRIAPGSIVAIADNDPAKDGMSVGGVTVRRFADIPRESYDLVVIASLPGRQAIGAQLRAAGLIMNKDFVGADQVEQWYDLVAEYELRAA